MPLPQVPFGLHLDYKLSHCPVCDYWKMTDISGCCTIALWNLLKLAAISSTALARLESSHPSG